MMKLGGRETRQKIQLKKGQQTSLRKILWYFLLTVFVIVLGLNLHFIFIWQENPQQQQQQQQNQSPLATNKLQNLKQESIQVKKDTFIDIHNHQDHNVQPQRLPPITTSNMTFLEWKKMAIDLAKLPPDQVLLQLEQFDPFAIRTFEQALQNKETELKRTLTKSEVQQLFPCPPIHSRISYPDYRNHSKIQQFHKFSDIGDSGYFILFQHLRKAGGTHFCSLVNENFPKHNMPRYYCMPDYDWNTTHSAINQRPFPKIKRKCAGCLHQWSNEDIIYNMKNKHHVVMGNEWDAFDPTRFFDLPAITVAASIRHPIDRALSQFRFECVEERGCVIKTIEEWWKKRTDLHNVYIRTFSDKKRMGAIVFDNQHAQQRQEAMSIALDTISKFHLILVMEWLAYSGDAIQSTLKFHTVESITKRVRPHIQQAQRNDNQEQNNLGSASISKASWNAKEYLSSEQYKIMSETLALDEIFSDFARRLFLERFVCT